MTVRSVVPAADQAANRCAYAPPTGRIGSSSMKLLYKPFALVTSVIAGRLGKSIFKSVWSKIDGGDPPSAMAEGASLPKVVAGAALQAATMAGVHATADRVSARAFEYFTGIWPGEKPRRNDSKRSD
jgi:hypothetical protein